MTTRAAEAELFSGSTVSAGFVRHHPSDPSFSKPRVVAGFRLVFPRLAVWIRTPRAHRYVSDPTVVEYYNDGDEYAREPWDPRGDATEWYSISEDAVRDVVGRYDAAAAAGQRPFRRTHGPTNVRAYAIQRVLFQRLSVRADVLDPLEVEETVLRLLDASLACTYGARRPAARPITRTEREIADRASAVLGRMTDRHATLTAISREAAVSVFHLSRIFRRVTGRTLAKHHLQLRLLASLEPLLESDAAIGEIATRHGFASHSHYGSTFIRTFAVSPSTLRSLSRRSQRRILGGSPAYLPSPSL